MITLVKKTKSCLMGFNSKKISYDDLTYTYSSVIFSILMQTQADTDRISLFFEHKSISQ